MTAPGMVQQAELNIFDERVDLLFNELELAVKWDRPAALLAICNSEYVRANAETALENLLIQQGQKIIHIQMDDLPDSKLISILQNYPSSGHVFFVTGLNQQPGEQTNIFIKLGNHQDILSDRKIRIIFWLTQNMITELLRTAPDFWEYRQRMIELPDEPKADQILQTTIESVWQGIGDYSEQFENTEDKINMRETFLSGLPKNDESTSTRANLLLTLGILHWRKGDYEKAKVNLQQAIQTAAKLEDNFFEAECFNAIALVYFGLGKNDEAIAAYKQAIAIAPEHIFVWNNLGNLCLKINRNDEAMLAFQKALKNNDKDPVAWTGLGAVYYTIGYLEESIAAYQIAIQYAPTLARPWNGLGDTYIRAGRDTDAAAAYQKAIELNKRFAASWLGLADIYRRQERSKDAIKMFQRALNINPDDHRVWNDLGLTFLKVNAFEEAAQSFAKASELDNGFGWAYCNLALAYGNQGKHSEAINLCKKSLSVFTEDSDKAVAWDRLAGFYRAINDYSLAVQAYQTADKLKDPNANVQPNSTPVSPKPASTGKTDIPSEDSLIAKTKIPATIQEVKPILKTQQEEQDFDGWTFDPETESENTILFTAKSENLPANNQSKEEPLMSTFFSHPILKTKPAPETLKKQPPTTLFDNEEEMTESKNAVVWNEKGNIHYQNGSYKDAAIAYNKAIELDRSFGWPYSNLALTYLTLGKYAEAILLYQKSICLLKTNEEKAASWNSLGNIYRQLNKYENALNAYQNADEIDPQNAGRRDKADFAYSETNSQNAQVWFELGNLFFKAQSYNEAVKAYTKSVKIDETSGWAHSNLAISLVFQGKHREAIPVYLKSIELFKNNKDKAVSWNRLGNVYRRMNEYDNAKKAYQNAIKLSEEKASLLTRTRFSLLGNCYSN
ncbi:MAG: tetratricopeptide repeat protein [Anaerolineales bacterium]|nr:tetratricopeptide repeat protein [Anaerolineales bacterium]